VVVVLAGIVEQSGILAERALHDVVNLDFSKQIRFSSDHGGSPADF
jgi:hypothetical protein